MPILRKTEIFEEFVMEKKIIYLKAEQSSYVNHEKIHIGDIASVFCEAGCCRDVYTCGGCVRNGSLSLMRKTKKKGEFFYQSYY